jgi:hypothetical protein
LLDAVRRLAAKDCNGLADPGDCNGLADPEDEQPT